MYVDNSATKQIEEAIKLNKNPKEGDLVVSDPCLMETCAWYVGQICAEYSEEFGWMHQPFARLTEYGTKEEAESWLKGMKEYYEE
jgi:hypothetical protein